MTTHNHTEPCLSQQKAHSLFLQMKKQNTWLGLAANEASGNQDPERTCPKGPFQVTRSAGVAWRLPIQGP